MALSEAQGGVGRVLGFEAPAHGPYRSSGRPNLMGSSHATIALYVVDYGDERPHLEAARFEAPHEVDCVDGFAA